MKKITKVLIIALSAVIVVMLVLLASCKGKAEDTRFKLYTPKDFYTQDGYLIWNNVSGAEYYVVMADGETQTTTENRISLDYWPSRVCDFYVKACNSNEKEYINSEYGEIKEVMVETPGLKYHLGTTNEGKYKRGEYYRVWQGDADLSSGILIFPDEKDGLPVIGTAGHGIDMYHRAFEPCEELTEIYFPEGFLVVAGEVFMGFTNLKKVHLPQSLTMLSFGAFAFTAIEEIDIPDYACVTYGFLGCNQLREVHFGTNSQCNSPFQYCNNLKTVTVSEENEHLKVVDNMLIQDGNQLAAVWDTKKVIVPDYVTQIHEYAISGPLVEEVYIHANYTGTGNICYRCVNLEKITVEEGNPIYYSKGNCLLYKHEIMGDMLVSVGKANGTTFDIPEGVVSIGQSVFQDRLDLKIINIAEGVEYLLEYAFYRCSNLEKINYPKESLKYIDQAFTGCPRESYYPCPESVTYCVYI